MLGKGVLLLPYLLLLLLPSLLPLPFAHAELDGGPLDASIESTTVVDILSSNPAFRSLIYALQRTRLIPLLNRLHNCTLFAPTNEAFPPSGHLSALTITGERLLYHILTTPLRTPAFIDGDVRESLYVRGTALGEGAGQRVKFDLPPPPSSMTASYKEPIWTVAGAPLSTTGLTDLTASNGVVHAVTRLMKPPPLIGRLIGADSDSEGDGDSDDDDDEGGGGGRERDGDGMHLHHLISNSVYRSILSTTSHPHTLLLPLATGMARAFSSHEWSYLSLSGATLDANLLIGQHLIHDHLYIGPRLRAQPEGFTISSVGGESLWIELDLESGGQVRVRDQQGGAPLGELAHLDILGANGVLHLLAAPIIPPPLLFTPMKILQGIGASLMAEDILHSGDPALIDTVSSPTPSITILARLDQWEGQGSWDDRSQAHVNGTSLEQLAYNILNATSLNASLRSLASLSEAEERVITVPSVLSSARTRGTAQPVRLLTRGGRVIQALGASGKAISIGEAIYVHPKGKGLAQQHPGTASIIPMNGLIDAPPLLLSWGAEAAASFMTAILSTDQAALLGDSKGLTIFLPSDTAIASSGLIFDYLSLPQAQPKLTSLLHTLIIPDRVVYSYDVPPASEEGLILHSLTGGRIRLRRPEGENGPVTLCGEGESGCFFTDTRHSAPTPLPPARVIDGDVAVENGAVHIVDRLPIPSSIPISPRDLLHGAGALVFLAALEHLGLTALLSPSSPIRYTFLAPPDSAFEGTSIPDLFADEWKLRRLVLGHILLGTPPIPQAPTEGSEVRLENMLDSGRIMSIAGDLGRIHVLGGVDVARILRVGRGDGGSVILKVDRVLDEAWVPWGWGPIAWILIGTTSLLIFGTVGVKGYRMYQRRRGYDQLRV